MNAPLTRKIAPLGLMACMAFTLCSCNLSDTGTVTVNTNVCGPEGMYSTPLSFVLTDDWGNIIDTETFTSDGTYQITNIPADEILNVNTSDFVTCSDGSIVEVASDTLAFDLNAQGGITINITGLPTVRHVTTPPPPSEGLTWTSQGTSHTSKNNTWGGVFK